MRTLYTVSYPGISPHDCEFVESIRKEHDSLHRNAIAAHFTIAFAAQGISEETYKEHVIEVARTSAQVPFVCRYAMLGANSEDETAYVFLVPDEGYSAISLLHDRIYTGPLEQFHRLDVPYIPHITVATLQDRKEAKQLCDRLNRLGVSITGFLHTLTIGTLQEGKFINHHEVQLGVA